MITYRGENEYSETCIRRPALLTLIQILQVKKATMLHFKVLIRSPVLKDQHVGGYSHLQCSLELWMSHNGDVLQNKNKN